MTVASLALLGRGFELPAQAAQQTFRSVLEAMARPGRVQTLGPSASAGVQAPGIGMGLCAVLLTLLDAECSLHIDAVLPSERLSPYLRFHTGVRLDADSAASDFVLMGAAHAEAGVWTWLRRGSDEAPQRGATLIVEVPSLDVAAPPSLPSGLQSGLRLRLRGPGIETVQHLSVGGFGADFWRARIAAQADFPRGVDLLLCCGERIAALPRSTLIELEA